KGAITSAAPWAKSPEAPLPTRKDRAGDFAHPTTEHHRLRRAAKRQSVGRNSEAYCASDTSHHPMPALDRLPDHRRRDLIRDLDVPDLALPLRAEIREQLRDHRHVADLVPAQPEPARDVFESRPAEHRQAVVDAVGAQLVELR